jgi:hypothetical protein
MIVISLEHESATYLWGRGGGAVVSVCMPRIVISLEHESATYSAYGDEGP